MYDFGASVATTSAEDITPHAALRKPFTPTPPPRLDNPRPMTHNPSMDSPQPPPVSTNHPETFIIPPTPFLPSGLRPISLPPPSPPREHHSGLLGASPVPPHFKHFSGEGFNKNHRDLKAMDEWMKFGGKSFGVIREEIEVEGSIEVGNTYGYHDGEDVEGSEMDGSDVLEYSDEDGSEMRVVGGDDEGVGLEADDMIDVKKREQSLI